MAEPVGPMTMVRRPHLRCHDVASMIRRNAAGKSCGWIRPPRVQGWGAPNHHPQVQPLCPSTQNLGPRPPAQSSASTDPGLRHGGTACPGGLPQMQGVLRPEPSTGRGRNLLPGGVAGPGPHWRRTEFPHAGSGLHPQPSENAVDTPESRRV